MSWSGKQIIAPYDFSPEALQAIQQALSLTDAPERVHVVFVLPELSPAEPGVIWEQIDDGARKEHAEKQMRSTLSEAGIPETVVMHVGLGDPGTVITDLAQKLDAALIVMPSHGRRGFQRIFLGSVAERVIRLAHCPVLVLKHHK